MAAYLPGHRHPDRRRPWTRRSRSAKPPGRAADRHRADRRPAAGGRGGRSSWRRDRGRPRRPVRPAHVPRRRPGVRRGGRRDAGRAIVDYRRPPDRMETAVGRRHGPGKRVILTVGTDCAIGKMSVALELRRSGPSRPAIGALRADRPDRDDDRGLGRRRRSGHQRLRPGHGRVAGRAGRGAAATGSSSRARARSTTRPTRR